MLNLIPLLPSLIHEVFASLEHTLGNSYAKRNSPASWTAQLNGDADPSHTTGSPVTVESVSLEVTGFTMKVKDAEGRETVWHASPGRDGRPIEFDGMVHPEASAVLRWAGSLGDPVRFHLDIRGVSDAGSAMSLQTQFPNREASA